MTGAVSDWLNAGGFPSAKGYNCIASRWLSEEQVRLCSGHPKVHFGTTVEGSWRGRGVHGESSGLSHNDALLTVSENFNAGMHSDIKTSIWFKFGMMIHTKVSIFVLDLMTLTFFQGHRFARKPQLMWQLSHKVFN